MKTIKFTPFILILIIFFILLKSVAGIDLKYYPNLEEISPKQISDLILKNFPSFSYDDRIIRFVINSDESIVSFTGYTTLHDFVGKTVKISGAMEADFERIIETANAIVTIDASSLDTGIKARDRKMYELLETQKYPEIIFTINRLTVDSYNLEKLDGSGLLEGNLNLHSINRTVEIYINGYIKDERIYLKGETTLIPTEFKITLPKPPIIIFFNKLKDEVKIEFDVVWSLLVDR